MRLPPTTHTYIHIPSNQSAVVVYGPSCWRGHYYYYLTLWFGVYVCLGEEFYIALEMIQYWKVTTHGVVGRFMMVRDRGIWVPKQIVPTLSFYAHLLLTMMTTTPRTQPTDNEGPIPPPSSLYTTPTTHHSPQHPK